MTSRNGNRKSIGNVLITGSAGLIGSALRAELIFRGIGVVGLDLRAPLGSENGDVRDIDCVREALANCDGVVHLAAVSRVEQGEKEPEKCWSVNIGGTSNVIQALNGSNKWLIFGSSREVYGQPAKLPVTEDFVLSPVNTYGHTKAEGERLVKAARDVGIRSAVVRFSNVYGSTQDHADRVIPAFVRAAINGTSLRVEGENCAFDFTHVYDVVDGIIKLIALLSEPRNPLPSPVHLVSGKSCSLGKLAQLVVALAEAEPSQIVQAPARDFDVSAFCGDPARAHALLGWHTRIPLERGIGHLIARITRTSRGVPLYGGRTS